jgi:hypothetical protein
MITGKGAIMHQATATAAAKAKVQAARVMLEFFGEVSAKNRLKSVTAAARLFDQCST